MAEAHKLVVIQDGTLAAMAGNPAFVKEFPFLRALYGGSKPQRSCCGRGLWKADAYHNAKRLLANLPPEKKATLKRLLGAKGVRLVYRNGPRTLQLTF